MCDCKRDFLVADFAVQKMSFHSIFIPFCKVYSSASYKSTQQGFLAFLILLFSLFINTHVNQNKCCLYDENALCVYILINPCVYIFNNILFFSSFFLLKVVLSVCSRSSCFFHISLWSHLIYFIFPYISSRWFLFSIHFNLNYSTRGFFCVIFILE